MKILKIPQLKKLFMPHACDAASGAQTVTPERMPPTKCELAIMLFFMSGFSGIVLGAYFKIAGVT